MDRSGRIVYLGTERNPKSCLGLHGLLEDGWQVVLTIAYVPEPSERTGLAARLERMQRRVLLLVERILLRTRKGTRLPFQDMAQSCREAGVRYLRTCDRTLRSVEESIRASRPDAIVSNGWMFRISGPIARSAEVGAVNCHSSHLPEYRGGNVTFAPLINAERRSGVTVHELIAEFDAGRILAQQRVELDASDGAESLNWKRAAITAGVLIEALEKLGDESVLSDNPPSPFYFRCTYQHYMRIRLTNLLRSWMGRPALRYEPNVRGKQ